MKRITPEAAGISSRQLKKFYDFLDACNLSTHSVIMSRGGKIFTECYYEPFGADFLHRMYSVSKSFVSIAVGFCIQDGLLALDDTMDKFFPEHIAADGAIVHKTTIRELLSMKTDQKGVNWFKKHPDDRSRVYFESPAAKKSGTLFDYDSSGSYMLCVIVEKLTGKPFLEYLQEKVLDDIGFSKDTYCIKAPGGYSFGDSGVMCTARDLHLFARFILNGGVWNVKRYLNEEYVRAATDMKNCTSDYGFCDHGSYGYGYLFWGAPDGCFSMLGMGNQVALCDPKHDFIFVINSDNQGNTRGYEQIFTGLYVYVINELGDPMPENAEENAILEESLKNKKLFCLKGAKTSPFAEKINGATFICNENPMDIKHFRLEFEGDEGVFHYENATGAKSLRFGFGHNVFMPFPEEGYSDLTANEYEPGNFYNSAISADWCEEQALRIRVQIIDKYFGNLAILIAFKNETEASVRMSKTAEDFLLEYNGVMDACRKQ